MPALTIELTDADQALLDALAHEMKSTPEELVVQNLRASMRDFIRNRIFFENIGLSGGTKARAPDYLGTTTEP